MADDTPAKIRGASDGWRKKSSAPSKSRYAFKPNVAVREKINESDLLQGLDSFLMTVKKTHQEVCDMVDSFEKENHNPDTMESPVPKVAESRDETLSPASGMDKNDTSGPPKESGEEEQGMTKEDKKRFNRYVRNAKECEEAGDVESAIALYEQAAAITDPGGKIAKKISKLQSKGRPNALAELGGVESVGGLCVSSEQLESPDVHGVRRHVSTGEYFFDGSFALPAAVYEKLYGYQRDGVRWLYDLRGKISGGAGGILGDDMGLGKTIQCAAFLAGLFHSRLVSKVLLVLPVSLVHHWADTLGQWCEGVKVKMYYGSSVADRDRALKSIDKKGGICITTYGMVNTSADRLSSVKGHWDYIILDEGHKIKNLKIQLNQQLSSISCDYRVMLTGTPVQNNLLEMWALFDWACQSRLLGSVQDFRDTFNTPIVRSNEKVATSYEKRLGAKKAELLRRTIAPHFLRREKSTTFKSKPSSEASESSAISSIVTPSEAVSVPQSSLPRKIDLIVWLRLSNEQRAMYESFLKSDRVQVVLNQSKSPLAAITVLKKVCDHPLLLQTTGVIARELEEEGVLPSFENDDVSTSTDDPSSEDCFASNLASTPMDQVIDVSSKLAFAVMLLDELKRQGDAVLVFSQSKRMLDILSKVLSARDVNHLRMDGTVKSSDRQESVRRFNSDENLFCFLLTTQVGGLGLTLTRANRVVILDPAWNPSVDNQAVDRAYRIGQKRDVIVYRLMTCSTVEEKIYQRQVFKGGLVRASMDETTQYRYFSKSDMQDLFTLVNPDASETQQTLSDLHGRGSYHPDVDDHLSRLESHPAVFGLSSHDRLFSIEGEIEEVDEESKVRIEMMTPRATPARGSKAGGMEPSQDTSMMEPSQDTSMIEGPDFGHGADEENTDGQMEEDTDNQMEENTDGQMDESGIQPPTFLDFGGTDGHDCGASQDSSDNFYSLEGDELSAEPSQKSCGSSENSDQRQDPPAQGGDGAVADDMQTALGSPSSTRSADLHTADGSESDQGGEFVESKKMTENEGFYGNENIPADSADEDEFLSAHGSSVAALSPRPDLTSADVLSPTPLGSEEGEEPWTDCGMSVDRSSSVDKDDGVDRSVSECNDNVAEPEPEIDTGFNDGCPRSVCEEHAQGAEPFRPDLCRCFLEEDDMEHYFSLLDMASSFEELGDLDAALESCADALDICSDDPKLHERTMHLYKLVSGTG